MVPRRWPLVPLHGLPVEIVDGDRSARYPKRDEFQDEGAIFLNSTNIVDNRLSLSECNRISDDKYAEIHKGRTMYSDIVMTTRGSIGKVALVKAAVLPRGLINAEMLLVRADGKTVDATFLFYVMCSDQFQGEVRNFASGSAQPQIPITDLRRVSIPIPPRPTQRKIAAILSAYDELIENNLRRIKILEEMAQNLYREWFIKFRFPGHKQTRFTESPPGPTPEGWQVFSLGEFAELKKDKFHSVLHSTLPLLDLAKMQRRTLSVGELGTPDELTTSRIVFEEDDILFGSIRPYLHKVALAPLCGVTNTSVLVIRPTAERLQSFLAVLLSSDETIRWADQHSGGTKMPVTGWETLRTMPVLMPKHDALDSFDAVARPMLHTIKTASIRNQNLRRTRDLLLPRLISGDVDVSELDIAVPEESEA